MGTKKRNPICSILWQDASYSYEDNLPDNSPPLQLTVGFIVSENEDYINIATNVNYNPGTKNLWPVDGFVIPKNAIKKLQKAGFRVKASENMSNRYVAEKEGCRRFIEFLAQNGELIIIDLRRRGQEDDSMTDYHAGTFCDNLSQALRIGGF